MARFALNWACSSRFSVRSGEPIGQHAGARSPNKRCKPGHRISQAPGHKPTPAEPVIQTRIHNGDNQRNQSAHPTREKASVDQPPEERIRFGRHGSVWHDRVAVARREKGGPREEPPFPSMSCVSFSLRKTHHKCCRSCPRAASQNRRRFVWLTGLR